MTKKKNEHILREIDPDWKEKIKTHYFKDTDDGFFNGRDLMKLAKKSYEEVYGEKAFWAMYIFFLIKNTGKTTWMINDIAFNWREYGLRFVIARRYAIERDHLANSGWTTEPLWEENDLIWKGNVCYDRKTKEYAGKLVSISGIEKSKSASTLSHQCFYFDEAVALPQEKLIPNFLKSLGRQISNALRIDITNNENVFVLANNNTLRWELFEYINVDFKAYTPQPIDEALTPDGKTPISALFWRMRGEDFESGQASHYENSAVGFLMALDPEFKSYMMSNESLDGFHPVLFNPKYELKKIFPYGFILNGWPYHILVIEYKGKEVKFVKKITKREMIKSFTYISMNTDDEVEYDMCVFNERAKKFVFWVQNEIFGKRLYFDSVIASACFNELLRDKNITTANKLKRK